jgi:hypothetical protein
MVARSWPIARTPALFEVLPVTDSHASWQAAARARVRISDPRAV